MSIQYKKDRVIFKDVVSVEEAETLLEWMQKKSVVKLDLSACTHMHAANLQVLMAAKPTVIAWPLEPTFADWLKSALK